LGSVIISPSEVVAVLFNNSNNQIHQTIIFQNRLPGAIAAVVAGASLSVSGLQMQIMFRNPVAGPYILGVSAGASLGVATLLMGTRWLPHSSFAAQLLNTPFSLAIAAGSGAALIFFLVYIISLSVKQNVSLLIIGLMIGSAIGAIVELLQAFAGKDELQKFVLWGFAGFRQLSLDEAKVMAIVCIVGLLHSFALVKPLHALLGGEVFAETVGVNVASTKRKTIVSTAILAGTVTAFCGPIAFVGLAVPHLSRSIFKTANTFLLMLSCIMIGAVICCFCNIISSLPGSDWALPLNTITSVLGAPFVIYVILKKPTLS
jgi:iron complex transport system permease protein